MAEDQSPQHSATSPTNPDRCIGHGRARAADAAIGMDAVYLPILRRDFERGLNVSGFVLELPISVRAIVRKKDKALLAKIDDGVRALTAAQHLLAVQKWLDLAYRPAPTISNTARRFWVELLLGTIAIALLSVALIQARRSRNSARESELEKSRILAAMSHEIRNSANALQIAVDLLARKPALDSQRSLIDAAVASSTSLSLLLNNALDYSRLEAGLFTSSGTPTDVLEFARKCLLAFAPLAQSKGVSCNFTQSTKRLPVLLVDNVLLQQILSNLLSNAVKFCDSGSVSVSLALESMRGGSAELHIRVSDTGPGMSSETINSIFKRYSQSVDGRAKGGTGLGLSICSEVVERMGGRITVDSKVMEGSCFSVALPVQLPNHFSEDRDEAAEHVQSTLPQSERRRVLLVEDHAYSAKMMTDLLEDMGCVVIVAGSGLDAACEVEARESFDLCLLDCSLPDTDGYSLARKIKEIETSRGRPRCAMVAVSALSGPEHEDLCRRAGFDAVLTKPINREQMDSLTQATTIQRIAATLLPLFWEHYKIDLTRLRKATCNEDWKDAAALAHRICGSAGVAGQKRISEVARQMLDMCTTMNDESATAQKKLWSGLIDELIRLDQSVDEYQGR